MPKCSSNCRKSGAFPSKWSSVMIISWHLTLGSCSELIENHRVTHSQIPKSPQTATSHRRQLSGMTRRVQSQYGKIFPRAPSPEGRYVHAHWAGKFVIGSCNARHKIRPRHCCPLSGQNRDLFLGKTKTLKLQVRFSILHRALPQRLLELRVEVRNIAKTALETDVCDGLLGGR
jgi:hypothetical protein